VQICSKQIQDGGWPQSGKKNEKSQYLRNILTDFDEIWHGVSVLRTPSVNKIFALKKFKMVPIRHMEKSRYLKKYLDQF